MTSQGIESVFLLLTVFTPFVGFLLIAAKMLLSERPSDRFAQLTARGSFYLSIGSFGVLLVMLALRGQPEYAVQNISWFTHGDEQFKLGFLVDSLSLGFAALTIVLAGLVSSFSETYMFRDEGYSRFYLLFLLATFGMLLVVLADNLAITIIGWEFLGITSALLIAFFHSRVGPIRNGFRAFVVYRIADVALLLALLYAHHTFGEASFSAMYRSHGSGEFIGSAGSAFIFGALLFISASGKSSILPFYPWLPRAMEGPTPSSALFYGALAVHAGPYLFLRNAPLVSASVLLSALLVCAGLLSALFTSFVGRTRSDVKTSLAYASMTQVALIYAEIGMHWYMLAAIHAAGHMCLRTYQFLRAPSALHDIHIRELLGVRAIQRSAFYDRVLPKSVQLWLYRIAFEEGGLSTTYDLLFVRIFVSIGNWFARLEQRGEERLDAFFAKWVRSEPL